MWYVRCVSLSISIKVKRYYHGFIAAKCTQCGANIEVDDTKEAGICKYCGNAFVTEKVINNYNTI